MLWIAFGLMAMLALALLASPLFTGKASNGDGSGPQAAKPEVTVYRDQLAELDRDVERGLLSESDAELARLEIQRRILALDRTPGQGVTRLAPARVRALAGIVGIGIVSGALGVYLIGGSPNLPGAPFADRVSTVVQHPGAEKTLPSVDMMISQLATRLESQPDDADGWRMLGWSYFSVQRYQQAADAYARAADLRGDVGEHWSALGEARVMAAGGQVTPDSLAAFNKAVAVDPSDARARFFVGLSKKQDGDGQGALDDWLILINEGASTTPWQAGLRARTEELAAALKVDISDRLPAAGARLPAVASAPKGPSAKDIQSAQQMSPEDRQAMIVGMVDRLARKLEENPRDAEGWVRLARSRKILGQEEAARTALERARAIFADEPEVQSTLNAAALELGIQVAREK